MAAFILLVVIPSLFSLLCGWIALYLLRFGFIQRLGKLKFFAVASCLIFFALFFGSWMGVIFSCEINRIFFDYQILSAVLPSGIYLWYGSGPGLTPHFSEYWLYVRVAKLVFLPLFVYLAWKHRREVTNAPHGLREDGIEV